MTHTHPPLDDRPNAHTSPPISAPDITSLSPLPAELQTLIYDFLISDHSPAHTITLSQLSKSCYAAFAPRLYKRIVVTDEAIERGLYRDAPARAGNSRKTHSKTRSSKLVAVGEGGSLPSKHELLRNCESLIITSLSAMYATAALAHEWEERSPTGLFNGVTHIALEPDCMEAYCEQGFLGPNNIRMPWPLENLSTACFRHPFPCPIEFEDYAMFFYSSCPDFGRQTSENHGDVTRFQNWQFGRGAPPPDCILSRDTIFIDMLPVELEDDEENSDVFSSQVGEITEYCFGCLMEWRDLEAGRPERHWIKLIFTNFNTTISPDGTIHYLSPDDKEAILDRAQSVIRRHLRMMLVEEAPECVGMANRIHIRGYEECEFCRKVSHRGVQGRSS
ncbi:hypothetical protein L202_01823 [Cryptococcus amylolentus CBS 6039]|uniref:Uncharacterized protein n=2 Tax=Cryptococcus amylolentus TaxID=104669 RepID=A0A1E3I7E9_9TREE|nr:hypothetical protein L202_01823 [Cryptococcus amylolentus CBS 6039]ODN83731.1 hypothetical protein L202_01823 [Cryptococcus amylolentus CBS 6039]ODO11199.1 hypothetical protein I350_01803 [Cryptococcus amylolentus CBS 6273]